MAAPQQPDVVPVLRVTPVNGTVKLPIPGGGGWGSAGVTVEVIYEDIADAVLPSRARLSVGPELSIDCGAVGQVLEDCDLSDWVGSPHGANGKKYTWSRGVRPLNSTASASAPWEVIVRVENAMPRQQRITIQPEPVIVNQSQDGEYVGSMARVGFASGHGTLESPVRAWVSGQDLLLFDEARILSEDAKLIVDLNSQAGAWVPWRTPATEAADGKITVNAARGAAFVFKPDLGTLTGEITITGPVGLSQTWALELRRRGELNAPLCGTGCEAGTACQVGLGRCVPGSAFATSMAENNLRYARGRRWADAVNAAVERTLELGDFLPDVYGERGFRGHADLPKRLLGSELPDFQNSPAGRGACVKDFEPAFTATFGQRVEHCSEDHWPTEEGDRCEFNVDTADPRAASSCAPTGGICEKLYESKVRDPFSVSACDAPSAAVVLQRNRELIPCLDVGYVTNGTPKASLTRMACRQLRAATLGLPAVTWVRAQAIADPAFYVSKSSDTDPSSILDVDQGDDDYLAWRDASVTGCVRTFQVARYDEPVDEFTFFPPELVRTPTTYNRFEIYLCPFRPVLMSGGEPEEADIAYSCFGPAGIVASDTLDAATSATDTTVEPSSGAASGEQLCEASYLPGAPTRSLPLAAPLLSQSDRSTYGPGSPLSVGELYLRCLDEIRREPPGNVAQRVERQRFDTFSELFGATDCVSLGRSFAALRALTGIGLPVEQERRRARLVQQWIGVLSFLARASLEQDDLSAHLADSGALTAETRDSLDRPAELQEVLALIEDGWAEVLSPERASSLLLATTDTWWTPDYRVPRPIASPDHEMTTALPVSMLDAATSHLLLADAVVRRAQTVRYESCLSGRSPPELEDAGNAIRTALLVEGLATSIFDAANYYSCEDTLHCTPHDSSASCVTVNGSKRCMIVDPNSATTLPREELAAPMARAREELIAALERVVQSEKALALCKNPMGIDDDDLPLFFGDPVGNSGRFFASSDYLMKTWASPAIESSVRALDQARDTWLASRDRALQQVVSDQGRDRQLEALAESYGGQIADACGLAGVEAKDVLSMFDRQSGSLEAVFCHVDPTCAKEKGAENPDCLRGSLGLAVLEVAAATTDIEISRTSMSNQLEIIALRSRECDELEINNNGNANIVNAHAAWMKRLIWEKAAADEAALDADAGLAALLNPGLSSSLPALVLHTFGTGRAERSLELGARMAVAQVEYEATMALRSDALALSKCYIELDAARVGLDNAALQIQKSLLLADLSANRFFEIQRKVQSLVAGGRASLERESARTLPAVAQIWWLDETVERYRREFEWAKRVTYLAMRAVEYDYQQSLGLRTQVLAASDPAQLETVFRELEREAAGRTLNRRRAEESTLVLSLRDDVLGLADRSAPGNGWGSSVSTRSWSSATRFMRRYSDREHAVYDLDGAYLGQGVPFSVSHDGILGLRCAERLWRVTATVQGDFVEAAVPAVPLLLLKRNTFFSQWCDGHGDGSPYQVAKVQSSAQLFREPGLGRTDTAPDAYAVAMLSAWLNTTRANFYAEQYGEGASEELAGRGLYGDYLLVFPEAGLLDRGFDMARVEDVLIRFDLLSVDDVHTN